MRTFCVIILVGAVVAEPPQYRRARFQPEKQSAQAPEPYPAAGFQPSKKFELPARQGLNAPATSYGVPADSYGAPLNTYAAPQTEYGVPETRNLNDNKNEVENFESNRAKASVEDVEETKGKLEVPKNNAEVVSAQGAYYVLLPGSQLQRVQFQTENDIRNMAYTARLQYRNEDRAPIFVYNAVPQYQSDAYVQLA